jgi:hypothetical protein
MLGFEAAQQRMSDCRRHGIARIAFVQERRDAVQLAQMLPHGRRRCVCELRQHARGRALEKRRGFDERALVRRQGA